MASVSFTAVVVTLAKDQTQSAWFDYVTGLQASPQMQISSQVYADGQPRMSWSEGYQTKLSCTVLAVTPAQRTLLELPESRGGWLGETVIVRDDRGRKFSAYFDPPTQITEHQYNGECDVQLTFTEVRYIDTQ